MIDEWNHRWQSTIYYGQTKVWFPATDIPKSEKLMKHTRLTVGRRARNISGFAFYRRQSAIVAQSRNPHLEMCPADTAGRTTRHPFTSYVTVVIL
jgi:hypothetical protein